MARAGVVGAKDRREGAEGGIFQRKSRSLSSSLAPKKCKGVLTDRPLVEMVPTIVNSIHVQKEQEVADLGMDDHDLVG